MRVTVEDGRIVEVKPLVLDAARWAHLLVDVTGAESEADVAARIVAKLADAHEQSEGRPLAVRVSLTGATALHNQLVARRDLLQDDIRASGFQLAAECWVEQLKIRTSGLPQAATAFPADSLDVAALLREAAGDPEFAESVKDLIATIGEKLPRDVQQEFVESEVLKRIFDDAQALLAGELP
jgi:hypothetical protein